MPSRAAYTALARGRSDTGCSTVLIPSVEEPLMVTPGVMGHIRPGGIVGLTRTSREHGIDSPARPERRFVPRQEYRDNGPADASRFLTGLVTCFATHEGIPAVARAAWRR